jgi:hypothetical protein
MVYNAFITTSHTGGPRVHRHGAARTDVVTAWEGPVRQPKEGKGGRRGERRWTCGEEETPQASQDGQGDERGNTSQTI